MDAWALVMCFIKLLKVISEMVCERNIERLPRLLLQLYKLKRLPRLQGDKGPSPTDYATDVGPSTSIPPEALISQSSHFGSTSLSSHYASIPQSPRHESPRSNGGGAGPGVGADDLRSEAHVSSDSNGSSMDGSLSGGHDRDEPIPPPSKRGLRNGVPSSSTELAVLRSAGRGARAEALPPSMGGAGSGRGLRPPPSGGNGARQHRPPWAAGPPAEVSAGEPVPPAPRARIMRKASSVDGALCNAGSPGVAPTTPGKQRRLGRKLHSAPTAHTNGGVSPDTYHTPSPSHQQPLGGSVTTSDSLIDSSPLDGISSSSLIDSGFDTPDPFRTSGRAHRPPSEEEMLSSAGSGMSVGSGGRPPEWGLQPTPESSPLSNGQSPSPSPPPPSPAPASPAMLTPPTLSPRGSGGSLIGLGSGSHPSNGLQAGPELPIGAASVPPPLDTFAVHEQARLRGAASDGSGTDSDGGGMPPVASSGVDEPGPAPDTLPEEGRPRVMEAEGGPNGSYAVVAPDSTDSDGKSRRWSRARPSPCADFLLRMQSLESSTNSKPKLNLPPNQGA
jgi:hypothetical protein